MTIVAAIEYPGGVLVGCDTCVSIGSERDMEDRPKWSLRCDGAFLFAIAGDVRTIQLADSAEFPRQPDGMTDQRYLEDIAVPAIIKAAKSRSNRSWKNNFDCLIAYHGGVYQVFTNGSVIRSGRKFAAVGSGGSLAKAALCQSMIDGVERTAAARLDLALRVASMIDDGVNDKFICTDIKWPVGGGG